MASMDKQLPLVMYKNDMRIVLGKASVGNDGAVQMQVYREHWPLVKELFTPKIGEFVIGPVPPVQMMFDYNQNSVKSKSQE